MSDYKDNAIIIREDTSPKFEINLYGEIITEPLDIKQYSKVKRLIYNGEGMGVTPNNIIDSINNLGFTHYNIGNPGSIPIGYLIRLEKLIRVMYIPKNESIVINLYPNYDLNNNSDILIIPKDKDTYIRYSTMNVRTLVDINMDRMYVDFNRQIKLKH